MRGGSVQIGMLDSGSRIVQNGTRVLCSICLVLPDIQAFEQYSRNTFVRLLVVNPRSAKKRNPKDCIHTM